jgi:GNAT superfamily N-acetyltransferase
MIEIDWNNPASLHTVVCRPALPKDTPDVMEMTRTIWDGHDYVPYVWDDWLADPQGLLAVAEFAGRAIGLGKLTKLSEDGWWLEGLRVHPDYQGRRIASHLMEYLYGIWESTANGVVRLATASSRFSIHHLCDRMGFCKMGEFSEFSAPVISGISNISETGFTPVQAGQETQAAQFANESPSLSYSYGLTDLGYRWVTPASSHMVDAVRKDNAWWWRKDKGLLVLMNWQEENGQITPRISLLACQHSDLPAMLDDTRRLAAVSGYPHIGWVASLHPELQPVLQACHFQRDWDEAIFVYEKARTN